MKQAQKSIYRKCFIWITGICWVAGLLIAGSDSPYMPFLNGIGLILFLSASLLLGRLFSPSHTEATDVIHPGCPQKRCPEETRPKKNNRKINSPYALGV